jgi:alkylmercury lyase
LQETAHRLEVDGKTIYGWCAWDTLFIPELLGSTARIISSCPVTGKEIQLTVSSAGIERVNLEQVVVSFLIPEESEFQENITASFCHFVYYFADRIAAEQWSATHPGTFILSLADAFRVGQLLNATRYNQTLNQ